MELEELCQGLLDALERFDEKILPLGLYSSDELDEAPRLVAQSQPQRKKPFPPPQHQAWKRAIP